MMSKLRQAMNYFANAISGQSGPKDFVLQPRHKKRYVVNHEHRILYCPIEKNSCTFFKRLLLEHSSFRDEFLIEDQVQRLIDWLVGKDLHEWGQVMSYLQRRRAQNLDHLVGEGVGPRETRRRELIDTVGKSVQTIVETYNRNQEARELAASVEAAVAQTALLEAGAVGLGTIVSIAVLSSSMDITGMLAAGTLAILGFFVIPFKRKQAKDNFKAKMLALRTKLLNALTTQFNDESESVIARLKDGVAPYTRYVRSERERLEAAEASLVELRAGLSALRARGQAVLKK